MPTLSSFEFATIRVVPRVERGEFVNVGVILFCLSRRFLNALVQVNEFRLHALCPGVDVDEVREHLDAMSRLCAGSPDAGPIGRLTQRERFHWLVAPRSTVIQISPVHSGVCDQPETALKDLFEQLVAV